MKIRFFLYLTLFACFSLLLAGCDEAGPSSAGGGTIGVREIDVSGRYLHFPVGADNERRKVKILADDSVHRYFDVEIAGSGHEPMYWASVDVGAFLGKKIVVTLDPPAEERLLDAVEQDDSIRPLPNLYQEELRPQFHFSPQQGWTNDPNGLVWQDGEYHLFFQHNPYGVYWGNMTWGHAVSSDLVHWEEIGDALHPDELGTMFSGSALIDHDNTSGLQKEGSLPPLVTFYTSAGLRSYSERPFTQSMAYSTDKGRTWTKYAGNPVVDHIEASNRDPKVFWHKESAKWVMVLYLDRGKFVLFGSKDLKSWAKLSDLEFPDGHECPELFELPVDDDPGNTRWIMWEGGGRHMIGRFDGEEFKPESAVLTSEWGANCYAAQTYNDVPDGRRIFIGWMRSGKEGYEKFFSGMPFNQQMTFPREFSLRTTEDGIRLYAQPAREIATLYTGELSRVDVGLAPGINPLTEIKGELFDLELVIALDSAKAIDLNVRGTGVKYDVASETLSMLGKSVQINPNKGTIDLRLLIDRTSIELFASNGRYVMSFNYSAKDVPYPLALTANGGSAKLKSLLVRELESIWQ